jgi:glycosyltransferase involved in cell wall biosynthesis
MITRMDSPTVSVVICAYTSERWDILNEAIGSCLRQTHPPTQVILVIDRNEAMYRRAKAELSRVTVLENTGPPGVSGGRNTGAADADGDVVAFLDDDAVAHDDWLQQLIRPYSDPEVLGVGGRIVPRWSEAPPAWFPEEFLWTVGCSYTGLPTENAQVRNPIGANLSVRRHLIAVAGGFDGSLGHVAGTGDTVTGTADETEFCIRLANKMPSGRWIYTPNAVVDHVVPPQRATWGFFVRRCHMEGTSKAVLTNITGAQRGLEAERKYVTRVLPLAVGRGLRQALRGDRSGAQRAAAVVAGLATTGVAYSRERVRQRLASRRRQP